MGKVWKEKRGKDGVEPGEGCLRDDAGDTESGNLDHSSRSLQRSSQSPGGNRRVNRA